MLKILFDERCIEAANIAETQRSKRVVYMSATITRHIIIIIIMIINHPVGSARFPYSLFRNKVPLTYPTRFFCILARIFRKSYLTTYPCSHTDILIYLYMLINIQ